MLRDPAELFGGEPKCNPPPRREAPPCPALTVRVARDGQSRDKPVKLGVTSLITAPELAATGNIWKVDPLGRAAIYSLYALRRKEINPEVANQYVKVPYPLHGASQSRVKPGVTVRPRQQ